MKPQLALARYLALNNEFGSPFIFKLTDRGFFSEVNGLLNAIVYGLAFKRRLIVDDTGFQGLHWSHFFSTELPTASERVKSSIPDEWVVSGSQAPHFDTINTFVRTRHRQWYPLWFPALSLRGSIFRIQRAIAVSFARPRVPALPPAGLRSPYAAFHIRRGDKTDGYLVGPDLIREGEATPLDSYLTILQRRSPHVRRIFVMTDDYGSVEELRRIGTGHDIVTLCQPEERGYRQADFISEIAQEKAKKLQRLLSETQIAEASDLFVAGFKSNVARFVVLRHLNPRRCFSVDSQPRWKPI